MGEPLSLPLIAGREVVKLYRVRVGGLLQRWCEGHVRAILQGPDEACLSVEHQPGDEGVCEECVRKGPTGRPRRSPPGMAYAVVPNVQLGSLEREPRTDLDRAQADELAHREALEGPKGRDWAIYIVDERARSWSLLYVVDGTRGA